MPGFQTHVTRGLLVLIPLSIVQPYLSLKYGLPLNLIHIAVGIFVISYLQGLTFPDLDMEGSIPYQWRDFWLLFDTLLITYIITERIPAKQSLGLPEYLMAVLITSFTLLLPLQYILNKIKHREILHNISTFILIGLLRTAVLFFCGTTAGISTQHSIILGLNGGAALMSGALIHLILDL